MLITLAVKLKMSYIDKIKIELVMSNYLNGWLIKYYKDILKQKENEKIN